MDAFRAKLVELGAEEFEGIDHPPLHDKRALAAWPDLLVARLSGIFVPGFIGVIFTTDFAHEVLVADAAEQLRINAKWFPEHTVSIESAYKVPLSTWDTLMRTLQLEGGVLDLREPVLE